ncbi:MAG: hydantoinase B/oxoprolinase family protein [Candidatus Tectomicrobia bacterium]|nr:hydantoinase B/oxoprolinase family protein [Candidatus Tectomicrobia bacterium]
MGLYVGIDTGGTFTDFVVLDESGAGQVFKIHSIPDNPAQAVLEGLRQLAVRRGATPRDFLAAVHHLFLSTTISTNAVITGGGARVGLLTTKGFRDLLEMRRGSRDSLYDNKTPPPPPLVPRCLRLPVEERMADDGSVVLPLQREDVAQAVATLQHEAVEAVAVAYLHSYCNPAHERETLTLLAELWPEVFVTASSEVAPAIGIYERTSTTVLNAYCGPLVKAFLAGLELTLRENGFQGQAFIMQSNGGMISPTQAAAFPVRTVLSGPAAGAMAGCAWSARLGMRNCITLDMGGTSTDVCLIEEGDPLVTTEAAIGPGRYRSILPSLDIKTIGAGGGSIAWLDGGKLLHVGPQSAGAVPGPVCYGLGGSQPTVTDANLVLGFLSPEHFFGGSLRLDRQAARRAIEEQIAAPLGLDVETAAFGITTLANTNMATAVREVSLDRGYDPRDFALIVGGGAGPLHACAVASEIGIETVIVPRDASAFSAHGLLATDLRHDFVATFTGLLEPANAAPLAALFRDLEQRARTELLREGVPESALRFTPFLDLRYKGQYHEICIPLAAADVGAGDFAGTRATFHARHDQLYGYAVKEDPIEVVNLRLAAVGKLSQPAWRDEPRQGASAEARPGRGARVYLGAQAGFRTVPAYEGEALAAGFSTAGPALIYHPYTTILVPPAFTVTLEPHGNYRLTRRQGAAEPSRARQATRQTTAAAAAAGIDPILTSVIGKNLESIAHEMGIAMTRTTSSPFFQVKDMCTAILDERGRILCQKEYLPLMAYTFPTMLEALLEFFGEEVGPGDVFITNDVFYGGNQLQDLAFFKPVFLEGELLFWTATKGHQVDLGGPILGGYNPRAREVWQETLRIPPLKVYERGVLRRDVWNFLMENTRLPRLVGRDFQAMIGGCIVGERRLHVLLERYGKARLRAHVEALLDSSETMTRAAIERLADGVYRADASTQDDGQDKEAVYTARLAAMVDGSSITFDFSGSDPQAPGWINGVYATSLSATVSTFFMCVDPLIPRNEGSLRPVRVRVPEGSFLNARYPAATVRGNFTCNDVIGDCVMKALAQMMPERVTACWARSLTCSIGGLNPRSRETYYDVMFMSYCGGGGATEGADGWSYIGMLTLGGGLTVQDLEIHERSRPHVFHELEYWPDSGGAGCWRGGLGARSRFTVSAPNPEIIMRGDTVNQSDGLFGGHAGKAGECRMGDASGELVAVPVNERYNPKSGVQIEFRSPGGGGFGEPLRRDAALVAEDVRHGYVSRRAALELYGVELHTDGGLDVEATERRRQARR